VTHNNRGDSVAIFGNCQSGPLTSLITHLAPELKMIRLKPVHLIDEGMKDDFFKLLLTIDILIHQQISGTFGDLSIDSLKKKFPNIKYISFPNIYFDGYFPFIRSYRLENGQTLKGTLGDYHDSRIYDGFVQGDSVDVVFETIINTNLETNIDEISKKSLATLQTRELNLDILISDYIQKEYQNKTLFYIYNHPVNEVLIEVALRILKFMGISPAIDKIKFVNGLREYLDLIIFPIQLCTVGNSSKNFINKSEKLELKLKDYIVLEFALYQFNKITVKGRKMNNNPVTLKDANRMFQSGQYSAALTAYNELYKNSPKLDFYEFNIFMCKKRLGLPVTYLESQILPGPKDDSSSLVEHFSGKSDTDIIFVEAKKLNLNILDQLDKLCFYVASLNNSINKIYYISDINTAAPSSYDIDEYPHYANLFDRIVFVPFAELNDEFVSSLKTKVISYVYDNKGLPDSLTSKHSVLRQIVKVSGNLWRVHDDVQHHGSFYLKSISDYNDCSDAKKRLKSKLISMKEYCKGKPVYLFGTGPSLKYSYCIDDVSSATVITCNSIVNNKTMLEYLKPEIICATDPIFHAGWGKYAAEFRKNLISAMHDYQFMLVVPSRDLHIYHKFLPHKFLNRVASYEFDASIEGLNNDLINSQKVAPRPNVLTNIMLPIASTLTTDIRIGGCDGKKDATSYFWEHDKASQFNNKMEDIQKEFKGFFDINYDKYYADHCKVLAEQIKFLLENNYVISSVTPSYIPILSELKSIPKSLENLNENLVDVAVVMPARNMEGTIVKSIDSVIKAANEAKQNYRIIVINENSTDNTLEIVGSTFSSEIDKGSIYIVNTIGLGVSCARNIGLAIANSTYVTFLDSDDLMSKCSLIERVRALKDSNEDVIGSFSKTKLMDVDNDKILSISNDFKKEGVIYDYKRVHGPTHISSILYKIDSIISLKFPEGVRFGEDWLFLSRALRGGGTLKFVADSHTVYNIHSESVTKKSPQDHIIGLFPILNKVYSTDDGYEGAGLKYCKGLNALGLSTGPSYLYKICELSVRLLACLYVTGQLSKSYSIFQSLYAENDLSFESINDMLASNIRKMHDVFERDVKRFSSIDKLQVEKVNLFVERSKVCQLLPSLRNLVS
jgi:glycosyltransferase involved in cell wall biosynthesis